MQTIVRKCPSKGREKDREAERACRGLAIVMISDHAVLFVYFSPNIRRHIFRVYTSHGFLSGD
jgi:hypothetical protein